MTLDPIDIEERARRMIRAQDIELDTIAECGGVTPRRSEIIWCDIARELLGLIHSLRAELDREKMRGDAHMQDAIDNDRALGVAQDRIAAWLDNFGPLDVPHEATKTEDGTWCCVVHQIIARYQTLPPPPPPEWGDMMRSLLSQPSQETESKNG